MTGKVEEVSEAGKHTGEVTVLLYSHDHVFSGGSDGLINVWDQDLKLIRPITAHGDFYVLALAANSQKHIYSSARDGSLRYFRTPLRNDNNVILLQTVADDVTALYCIDNILYSGDDKGIVTKWYHNQVGCQYNVLEEVKALFVEGPNLYTARDTDAVITDITPRVMSYTTKGVIPGRAPLQLFGPEIDGHKSYLAAATRDGKGLTLVRNSDKYDVMWTKEGAHDMIINAMCATEDALFTAGFDGKVKKWVDFDKGPKLAAEVDTGKCINALCLGPDNTIYAGDSEGVVKRISFNA